MHYTIDRNGLIGLMSGMVLGTAVLVVSLLVAYGVAAALIAGGLFVAGIIVGIILSALDMPTNIL